MSETPRGKLKLAFSWHIAKEITDADLEIAEGEEAWMSKVFPRDTLVDAGFIDSDGKATSEFESCLGEALAMLPEVLPLSEKLIMLTTLFEGTLADDDFHHEEGNVLVKAASLLGVRPSELDEHLASLDQVGEVELD